MNDKFRLTENSQMDEGTTVYQLEALKDFGSVKRGELGGFVEKEENVSAEPGDDAWVYEGGIAKGESRILHHSAVDCDAVVHDTRLDNRSYVGGTNIGSPSYVENSRLDHSQVIDSHVQHSEVKESYIDEEADVYGATIEGSKIEERGHVHRSVVVNSIVSDFPTRVTEDTHVENSILTNGTDVKQSYLNSCERHGDTIHNETIDESLSLSNDDLKDLDNDPDLQQ